MVKVASITGIIKGLKPRQQKVMKSHARHHSLRKQKFLKNIYQVLKVVKDQLEQVLLRLCQKHIKEDKEYQDQCLKQGTNNGC